jgi:hypothetical protein
MIQPSGRRAMRGLQLLGSTSGMRPMAGRRQQQEGVTRVSLANVLDEGLRIRGRGNWMNSKVKIQTNKAKRGAY